MSATSQSEPCCNGLARRPVLEVVWVVFKIRGAVGCHLTQAEAEHDADLHYRHDPDELVWVAPWPAQLEYYPRRPWCYLDELFHRSHKALQARGR